MLVYRVENPENRRGPFRDGGLLRSRIGKKQMRRLMKLVKRTYDGDPDSPCPCPHDDLNRCSFETRERFWEYIADEDAQKSYHGTDPRDLLFGCSSQEQFDLWFVPEAKAILGNAGYQEAVYSVPDDKVMELTAQVGFIRKYGELVQWRPLAQSQQQAA